MPLAELQSRLHNWRKQNFPESNWEHHMLGCMEELGELSHALLKQAQNIRGSGERHEANAKDAVGDLMIYLMGVCSDRGWDIQSILEDTAAGVLQRDWILYPHDGVTA